MPGGSEKLGRIGGALFRIWVASQPFLQKPRWWSAHILRLFLWRTTFIAITGSNGKSTATRILAAILASQAPTQWTRMNRNGPGGVTETIAFCVPWKTRFAVFEVGAGERGKIDRLVRLIRPHIAVVLSVFLEHRVLLRTLDGVAREKAKLFARLPPHGVAVVNADDPHVSGMSVPPGRKIIRFGASAANDVYYEHVTSAWPQLLCFTAVIQGQRQEIRTRLLGTHWVGPVMACIAVANHLGIAPDQIARAIEQVPPYPGRMQVVRLPSGCVVIRDEFKGSQHTIKAAFRELRNASAGRKILVFCDVAESSLSPRDRLEKIGRKVAACADFALFIGDKAHHGVSGAIKGGLAKEQAMACADFAAAARFLKPMLGPGDVLLLKAERNHQLTRLFYSLLGDVRCTVPLCDKRVVCDECMEFRNPDLVQLANEQLTAVAD